MAAAWLFTGRMHSYPRGGLTAPDIALARRELARVDPALARADAATPPFAWRLRPGGFAALTKLIVEQQVSVASAEAIWRRVEAGLGAVTPDAVLAAGEAGLRACGLSGPKARYTLGLAQAERRGDIDLEGLRALDDEAAVTALTRLNGVGRWTAEVYLMFSEGRTDIFPAGDVALQHGLRLGGGMAARPLAPELAARALGWRPHRGVAAHLLWAYYAAVRRGGVVPDPSSIVAD